MSQYNDNSSDDAAVGCVMQLIMFTILIVFAPIVGGMRIGYYGHRVRLASKIQYLLGFLVCAYVVYAVAIGDIVFWWLFALPFYMTVPYGIGRVLRPRQPSHSGFDYDVR